MQIDNVWQICKGEHMDCYEWMEKKKILGSCIIYTFMHHKNMHSWPSFDETDFIKEVLS